MCTCLLVVTCISEFFMYECIFGFTIVLDVLQVPVPDLKQQIATVTGVLSDQQRLICRGKVLKDDQRLCAYRILFVNFSFSFFFFLLCLCSHSLLGNYYQLPLYGFQMIVVVLIILKQMNFIHLLYLNLLVIAIFRL